MTMTEAQMRLFELLAEQEIEELGEAQTIPRLAPGEKRPMSFAQERLWLLDRFEPGNPAYNMPVALKLAGVLDQAALARAFREVVRRHETLRTFFRVDEDRPVQVTVPVGQVAAGALPVVDLGRLPASARERLARRLTGEEAASPFDLAAAPPIRLKLLRLAAREHVLLLTMHHILSDGWSVGVLTRELATLYESFRNGTPSRLPELPLQYADFAAWQRRWLAGEALEEQLGYWRRQLAGLEGTLELPTDRPRAPIQTYRGGTRTLTLDGELSGRLDALSRRHNATIFMTLLAGFKALLGRLAGQTDVAVGTPIAGRDRAEIQGLIGIFLNTLVLRTRLDGAPSFDELLDRVRKTTLGAYAHQEIPIEKLIDELHPQRDLSRPPWFQVFFNMLNLPVQEARLPDLTLTPLAVPELASKFDLTVYARQEERGIHLEVVYNRDLFDAARIDEMLRQYELLLAQAVADPSRPVDALDLVTAAARPRLPDPAAPLDPAWLGAAHELFYAAASADGEREAVVDRVGRWSYREVAAASHRVAHRLREAGLERGGAVVIYAYRAAPLAWAVLGTLEAGGAFVILDPAYPPERLANMVRQAAPAAWIAIAAAGPPPAELAAACAELGCPRLDLGDGVTDGCLAGAATSPLGLELGPDDLAYLAFTSGSTGQPKGVLGRHGPLSHFLPFLRERFGLRAGDRYSMLSGLSHDPLHRDLFMPLALEGTIVIPDPEQIFTPGYLGAWAAREGVTVANLTPAMGQVLALGAGTSEVPSLRYVFLVGDVLSRRDVEGLRRLAPAVTCVNLYGATETQRAVSFYESPPGEGAGDDGRQILPLGSGLRGVQLLVVNSAGAQAGVGELGEILMRSPHLAAGYLNDPELTAARFQANALAGPDADPADRVYRTGDLGRYRPDGHVTFAGRRDRQVKVRGFRIELGEVETWLGAAPGVERAAVVARQEGADRRLVAFVAGAGGTAPAAAPLRVFLEARLPSYMIPSVFVPLESLPLTPNGKVDRAALARRELPEAEGAAAGEFVAPRTPVEEMLAAIWRQVLGVERLGVHEDFFALGGHSLLAAQLMSRVERAFGVAVPMRRLFERPTVAQLAALVTELGGRRQTDAWLPALEPSPTGRDEPFPLTDIQGAYWVGRSEGLELGAGATHRYLELESPDLDVPRFERAWQRLVERHGMLRAVVTSDGRQKVLPEVPPYEIRVLDLTGEDRESVEARLEAVRDELSHQVLPADAWPLFEIRASRHDGRVRIHFSIDLLIGDAWSFRLLGSELGRLYADPDAALAPLEISFRDYVLAEAALRASPLYERALAYWRQRLLTLPPAPELPLAKSPDAIRQPRFVRRQGRLDREKWTRLQSLGTAAGLTSSAVLLTAFAEVLACWSKSPRFTVNLTLFNRLPMHPQVNQLVGDFTSVTLLEVDHAGAECFSARARRLLERLWDDLDHRLVSGVRVLRERRRLQPGAGIMPVVFTSTLNLSAAEAADDQETPKLQGEMLFGVSQTSQVWIDHQVTEADGELSYSWDVVDELFPAGMVDAMFAAYRRLLERLVDDEDVWRRRLGADLLVPAEQLDERARVNATAAPVPPGLLHARFLDQARRQPDRPAVIAGERRVTYGELLAGSARLARELRRRGARPDRLVAVVMEKGWEQVLGVLGILRSGAAYLPVDPHLPHERLELLLEHAEVDVALTQPRLAEGLEWPGGVARVALDESWLAGEAEDGLEEPVQTPEDLAYVIFTSGSTGLPKGVMIDHRGALNTVVDVNERFAVGAADRVLALSALNFDLSVYDVFGPLAVGAVLVLPEPAATRDPSRWAELVREHGVTTWNTVPALMEMLVEYAAGQPGLSLSTLRLVLMSGDWIPVTLPDRIEGLTGRRRVGGLPADDGEIQVISLGGATEASIWSILYPIEEVPPEWTSIPYGVPMVNQSFAVLDDALDPRPLWTPGQLFIGGVGLAKGYWRDSEKTAASFVTHPRSGERLYRTGDLGRYLPGGAIEFLGREDFQVKVQGHRIELGEIEAALLRHPAVRAAVAVAVGDARGQKRLVAYVVLDEGSEATAEEVRVFLAGKLPEHMVPGVFLFLEELPLTANGKVDRKALPAPEALEAKTEYEAPRNDVERRLAEIWQEQLGGAEIGIHDNFFELGGDSLMAIRVITRAGEAGIRLEPRHVFEHQTIAELSPLAVEVAPAEAEPSWNEEEPASSEPDFADSGLAPDQLDKVLAKLKGMS